MKLRVLLILALILAAAAAGFFLWFRSRNVALEGTRTSPVLVDLITPANGASATQGEPLSILAQAWSPSPLASVQLWVDGEMVAVENVEASAMPFKVSWDWEAGNPGVHSLFVTASDTEGVTGQSQSLIINVSAAGFSQLSAAGGQSLADIGAQLGVPVIDLQGANPGLDPQLPLSEGQPVILPPSPVTGGEEDDGAGEPPSRPELVIHWQFTPLEEVDKAYCYESLGGDIWQKTPADPFSFFPNDEWLQTLFPSEQQLNLQMECWGWQGGTLKYLGAGQTNLNFAQIPDAIVIAAAGFYMDGLPEQKPLGGGGLPPDEDLQVPAPFALREAETVAECIQHNTTISSINILCDELINAQMKQYYILVWEWEPKICWPNTSCAQANEIGGYEIFEKGPMGSDVYMKDIPNAGQKVTAVALPWGAKCYGVRAYIENPAFGKVNSDVTTWCGDPPEPEKLVLTPTYWLSSEGMWINEGCDNWADAFRLKPTGSQIAVGFFLFADDDYCDIKQGGGTAAAKFTNFSIPQEAVLHRATLKFTQVGVKYGFPFDVAVNYNPGSCATRIGKAKSDWTALSSGHFINPDTLGPYYTAYTSAGSPWSGDKTIDVTGAVLGWMENPSTNHGFIFIADLGNLYNSHIFEPGWDIKICYSLYDNIELEIQYFEPN
ncbi:MAG: Ig-like domain-containing protein [Anaerolineales bacterium]